LNCASSVGRKIACHADRDYLLYVLNILVVGMKLVHADIGKEARFGSF
jgi:hypothetical protein